MQINLGKGRAEVPPHRLQQSLFLSVHKGNKGNEIYIVHELNKLTKLNRKIARFERALKNDVFFIKIHKTNWIAMIFCCNPFFVVIGDL